ncbi:MAG TPA: hypothetical protein VEV16_08765 [Daejeonella sp.]|nr:hypothetical protein [Daejeonella sp.]
MKGIKKNISIGISTFLLLCFSITVLPLDIFHTHGFIPNNCEKKKSGPSESCQHQFHVSSKKSYCWVCAVHFDKAFTSVETSEETTFTPTIFLFLENGFAEYFIDQIFSTLRGPPQN